MIPTFFEDGLSLLRSSETASRVFFQDARSLKRWLEIRDFERSRYKCKDVLFPVAFRKGTLWHHGSNASLKEAFSGVELGTWTIDENAMTSCVVASAKSVRKLFWNSVREIPPSCFRIG